MASEKLLITTANLTPDFLKQLDRERREIRGAILYDAGELVDLSELNSLDYPSLWDLFGTSSGQAITMLHYIGHSSEEGLLMQGPGGTMQLANDDLSALFKRLPKPLRFVFLNSCCSDTTARALLQAGIPYVVGTSKAISDKTAVLVAKKFYEILGDINQSTTVEDAFEATKRYFKNHPDQPLGQLADDHRGGSMRKSADFPWQLHKRDDLTDEQRNWTLIPPKAPVLSKSTELNALYRVTPKSAAGRPFSFFLSYTIADKEVAQTLVHQIQVAFRLYGKMDSIWQDDSRTDATQRTSQLTDNLNLADFVFLLVNDAFLTNPLLEQVISLTKARFDTGQLSSPPIVLPTVECNWQDSAAGSFNSFPLSGEPVTANMLDEFSNELYNQWMRLMRQKR
ncbi:hypothetical protein DYU11_29530 [Fibrisoma montanum]|uniref:CHAT domain-containing protein n=1 Tax=Fibrisoma montanum TaxID=2305895 RepID=A0A418LXL3_9BACT|nr:CHAT domain-containing protein [Fibrisoma montanum]RIV18099.1 hypothetical protein DYU11_29530 [Fibrisoma montanum]